jgi:STE24 endopeptidase
LRRQITAVAAHRAAVPLDFAREVTLDEHCRAADYTLARARFAIAETVYDAAVASLWLLFWLAPLYALVAAVTEPGLTRSVALVVAFGAIGYLLDLPFALARVFRLEARFGFNRLTPVMFLRDETKSLALQLALGLPLLYGMFALLRALPRTWWLFAYAAFMGVVLLLMVIYPTLIAPLFNKFTPLADDRLKRRMEALLEKCGFESKGLFVMDASKRSAHGNAYFTGFGKAKRIVFFDTLLEKHSPEEIESILAHELGHFKYGHVRQMIVQAAALAFVGFAVLHWAFSVGGLAGWLGLPDDPGVVLIALLLAKDPVLHLLSPALAWRSRRAEFEADDFAGKIVGKEPMISALTRLTRDNLATLTPDAIYASFYYSHPPVPARVAHLRRVE